MFLMFVNLPNCRTDVYSSEHTLEDSCPTKPSDDEDGTK